MHNGSRQAREQDPQTGYTRTIVFTPAWAGARGRWRRKEPPVAPVQEHHAVPHASAEPALEEIVVCEPSPEPPPCTPEAASAVIVALATDPVAVLIAEPPATPLDEPKVEPRVYDPRPIAAVEPAPFELRSLPEAAVVSIHESIVESDCTHVPIPAMPEGKATVAARSPAAFAPAALALMLLLGVVIGGGLVAVIDRWNQPAVPAVPQYSAEFAALRQALEAERAAGRESAGRLARIESRLNEMTAPPAPDLKPIDTELQALRERLDHLVADGQSLKGLPNVVSSLKADFDKTLAAVQASLNTLLTEERRGAHTYADQSQIVERLYARGVAAFERGDCAAAAAIFQVVAEADAKDPRVWYYLALCTAKITRDWQNAPRDYWQKGVACEREAPETSHQVDMAFASLSQANGRDWLAYYRSAVRRSAGASSAW